MPDTHCTFDLGICWYLHDLASPLMRDAAYNEEARNVTLSLEQGIVLCEDDGQADAAVQLDEPELRFLISLAQKAHRDSLGQPIGALALFQLIRARIRLEVGDMPGSADGDRRWSEVQRADADEGSPDNAGAAGDDPLAGQIYES